jgi:DNA-directed RNA polymerase subunit L
VKFVGYKKPHPLMNKIELKIQTTAQTKPIEVLDKAIHQLTLNINSMGYKFQEEFEKYNKSRNI